MGAIEDLVKDDIKLPSPPAVAVRIIEAIRGDDASFNKLASIISADPALSARILGIANSSFYALPYKVDNIERAVSILGVNALKNIALSFVIVKEMRGHSEERFDIILFWKRAITAAVGAELITSLIDQKSDDTFVTSLLQDIGVLIMYYSRPLDYMKVLDEKIATGLPVEIIEREIIGVDHQEVGAEILQKWGIPENIFTPIRYHHTNKGVPHEYKLSSEILFLSDKISSVYHGTGSAEKIQEIKDILCKRSEISDEKIDGLIDTVAENTVEILSSFEIDPGNMKPFSQIIQEANEELGKLNLSYEQLVMELKQAKEKAEKLAHELKDANEKLRKMVISDGLTDLYNHRYFQELIDSELSRALRYRRPLSLIMFDIDHFKKINDSYGHPIGDIVLKTISAQVKKIIRSNDIAARYGGEEFVIILPETDIKGATIVAERLRIVIEKMEIQEAEFKIKTTISIGVTAYLPHIGVKEKAELIDDADKALYNSKNNGRNRISVSD